jgi:hypothetical protein
MQYEDFANQLKSEYELFLFALSGRYLALMAPGIAASPMSINQFEQSARELRATFLQTANRSIVGYVAGVAVDTVSELTRDFGEQLADASAQNIDSLATRMKGMKVNALDAVGDVHGAMGLLLQSKLATPEFNVVTASGRTFKAAPLVRSQARHFAYQTWLYQQMVSQSWEGDLAQVVYDDPNHDNHGLVFSMSGATPGYPSFDDLIEGVFHYNANAKIAPHVSP